ncbi:unnamed protein product [Scytosiphon promiscuus]
MRVWTASFLYACCLGLERGAVALGSIDGIGEEDLTSSWRILDDYPRTKELPSGLRAAIVGGDNGDLNSWDSTGFLQISSGETASAGVASSERRRLSDGGREGEDTSVVSQGESGGTPAFQVSLEAPDQRQPPQEEEDAGDVGPGPRIEKMGEHWTQHASVPSLPGAVLENARSVYSEISEDILARWGHKYADTPLFSRGIRFSDGGTVVENKMLQAVVEQRGFLAAFTGVSTTAGHDCLYEQSYPVLLNGTMGRLMAAVGVRFEAINVAMGNTRVAPYSFCVDAHAGLDADLISWDMTMMVATNECGRAAAMVELFIRSASVLPKRPAVLLTDASPNQELCSNGHLRQIEKQDQGLTGNCVPSLDLAEVYRDFGLHQISPRSLVPELTCGDDVFARARLYNNTEKDSPRPVGWHAGPAGHQLLSDMLFMNYGEVLLSALERLERVLPGVTMAGLRKPGVLLSNGRESLKESLGLAEGSGSTHDAGVGEDVGADGEAYVGGGRGVTLPTPAWCKGWRFCDWAGKYRCANTYFPLAGRDGSGLLDLVSGRTPAVANRDRSAYFVEPSPGRWAVTLNEESPFYKQYLSMPPPEGYHHPIDSKWVLVGDKDSGPIEFEFETQEEPSGRERRQQRQRRRRAAVEEEGGANARTGAARPEHRRGALSVARNDTSDTSDNGGEKDATPTTAQPAVASVAGEAEQFDSRVTICKPDFIDRVAFNETADVRISIDGSPVPVVVLVQLGLYPGSCVVLDAEVGAGRHTVKVEPLRTGEPYVAISHVVYPA